MSRTIAVGLLILAIALVLLTAVLTSPAQQFPPISCMPDDETREKVRAIMLEGLDQALKDHVANAFEVWMKDARDQPARAANGIRHGIRAYVNSRDFVLKWNPPPCP